MDKLDAALTGGRDAQLSVIGSMLIDDRCVPLVLRKLRLEDFVDGTCRSTFKAIQELAREGRPMCGFGIHLEKRLHRFDRLWERSPSEWDMWMNHVDKLPDGTWCGWGHVLDYIGVEWREPWRQFETQMKLGDV